MYRSTLLLAAVLAAPAFAQNMPPATDTNARGMHEAPAKDARTITRTDETGATTSVYGKKDGNRWRLDLIRSFPARANIASSAEHHTVLNFEGTADKDAAIEKLFTSPPADAEDWKDAIEDAAGVEFDFDYDAPDWDADRAPDSATASNGTSNDTGLRASARKAYEEARRRWREMTGKTRNTDLDTRAAGPNTDRLRLHNGEVVSGEIGKIEGDVIHVKTADGKDREVRRQDIARVEFKTGPRVNFGVTVVDSQGTGARVTQVAPGSAAGKAGVQVGDVITKFGDQAIQSADQLRAQLATKKVGDEVTFQVRRGNDTKDFKVTFEAPGSASKK